MKVTFFAPWQTPDGIYTYTKFLTDSLKKFGVETAIVPQQDFDVSLSPQSSLQDVERIREAGNRLSQGSLAHIQHEFGLIGHWKNPFDKTLKTLIGSIEVPTVITMHGFHPWMLEMDPTRPHPPFRLAKKAIRFWVSRSPWARFTFGKVFNRADAVIVHNQFTKDHLVSLGVTQSKVTVIPHGVITTTRNVRRLQVGLFREKYGMDKNKKLLTVFGFIDYSKGYELVFDILAEMPREYNLLIAGGTRLKEQEKYQKTLEDLIVQKGLQDRVTITGFLAQSEIPALMQETEILLVPQRYANTSGSLHVGLGAGKAIVASDLEFAQEINKRVACLSLFERGSAKDLKEKTLQLINNFDKRKGLEEKALEYARQFSWDEVAKLHLSTYLQFNSKF